MADRDVLDQLDFILKTAPEDEVIVTLLKYIVIKTAEIKVSIEALVPVIGAIAGRVGVSGAEIRRLTGVDQERE